MATPAERVSERHIPLQSVETCEWCEQPIAPDRLKAVRGRIAARERELSLEATAALREDFARECNQRDARFQAESAERERIAREEAGVAAQSVFDERLAQLRSERDERENTLRLQVTYQEAQRLAAESTVSSLTSELQRARTEEIAAAREQARAEARQATQSTVQDALQRAAQAEQRIVELLRTTSAEKDAAVEGITKKLTEANERIAEFESQHRDALQQIQTLTTAHENTLSQRLREQHEALSQDRDQKIREAEARAFTERQKLQNTVADLTRQLEQINAHERGEGAEINLYDALKAAYEADRIKHVPKGTAGPDIIHDVVQHGKVCGRIVYDSKDRNDYKKEYAKKLRNDQIALKADYAILASRRFPKKSGQLHLDAGVIVANPARVVVLAAILRRHILQVHGLRLSNEEREAKTEALYKFITSEPCKQLLESVEKSLKELFDLDVAEHEAHSKVWRQRGRLLTALLKVHGDLCSAFDRIVGTLE